MQFNLRSAIPLATAAGLAATLTLSPVRSVTADDDGGAQGTCSNRTLRGDYGFSIDGQILGGPSPILIRGVALTHFDGDRDGNLSQVDFVTLNGIPASPDWRRATGTYDLNPDCTGTMQLDFGGGSPILRLRLVVADRGREIRTVVESGPSAGSTGTKVH
jgi:hypothetical protein